MDLLDELYDDFNIEDKLIEQNHEFIEILNKKKHFKIKMPVLFGNKAS